MLRTWNEEDDVPMLNPVPREVAGLADSLPPHDVPKSSKRSRNSTKVDVLGEWVALEAYPSPEVMTKLPCAESTSLLKMSIPDLDPEEYPSY